MKEIKIKGRGGTHTLEQLSDKEYKLHSYADNIRIGLEKDNETIYFIDPPGGPAMYVGSELPGVPKSVIKSFRFDNGPIITVL